MYLQVDGIYLSSSEEIQEQTLSHFKLRIAIKAIPHKHKTWLHHSTADISLDSGRILY